MRQSRYLLWFNELSKNRRIQSSFVSRKWRSWVSRFFTYCLINQTQTQWDFCVVGLYNLGLYWKKNSKVYAYKGLVFQSFSQFAQWKFPSKFSKLPYSIIYVLHQILKFLSPIFIMKNGKSYLLWVFYRHVKYEAFYWYIFSYTDSTMYIWYCLVFIRIYYLSEVNVKLERL